MPTVPASRPSTAMINALIIEPCDRYATRVKPVSVRAKYSGGPKLNAALPSTGAKQHQADHPDVPAINEPKAEMPSAAPARPCRAMR